MHYHWLQVFNWRVVDCDFAVGLCTLLSETEVFKILWKVIDGTWQNYEKILVGNSKFVSASHMFISQMMMVYFECICLLCLLFLSTHWGEWQIHSLSTKRKKMK